MSQHLLLTIDDVAYALPVGLVQAVVPCGIVTPVPGGPASLYGLANIGGQLVPVVTVGPARDSAAGTPPRILAFLEQANERCALLADSTSGIGKPAAAQILNLTDLMKDLHHHG